MLLRLVNDHGDDGHGAEADAAAARAADLRAVVLLAGSVRASEFRKALARAPTGLPVASGLSVLDVWRAHLHEAMRRWGLAELTVRVIIDSDTPLAPGPVPGEGPTIHIEHDPEPFRGPGGLLRDLALEYQPEDHLLVGHGSQLLMEPLADTVEALARVGGDVAIACDPEGMPSGLMLIRVKCLRGIKLKGFIDLNEQAMPEIAKRHDVRVVRLERPLGTSIRTMQSYIEALRTYHRQAAGQRPPASPLDEDLRPSFTLSESGAWVHETAVVHDSVVLNGARVEAGAVLVRSVVCPGAVVGRGRHAVDSLVTGRRVASRGGFA